MCGVVEVFVFDIKKEVIEGVGEQDWSVEVEVFEAEEVGVVDLVVALELGVQDVEVEGEVVALDVEVGGDGAAEAEDGALVVGVEFELVFDDELDERVEFGEQFRGGEVVRLFEVFGALEQARIARFEVLLVVVEVGEEDVVFDDDFVVFLDDVVF